MSEMNWDLTAFFPGEPGLTFPAFMAALEDEIATLEKLTLDGVPPEGLADAMLRFEDVGARLRHAGAWAGCRLADDVGDPGARADQARLAALAAKLDAFEARLALALGARPAGEITVVCDRLPGGEEAVRRLAAEGARRMDGPREALAAALGRDGVHAWGRLYQQVGGRLRFRMRWPDGREELLGMSRRRTLMEDPDPAVRRAAFEGGNEAWSEASPTVLAALNAIVGTRLTLLQARGYDDVLDVACADSRIRRGTLDALMEAVEEGGAIARRYLAIKASVLGQPHIGFHEFTAPLPGTSETRLSWEQARQRVRDALGAVWPALGDYTAEAFASRWVEAEPRNGKSPGGFCTSSPLIGESRIFMTFQGSSGDVQTLAHELGHAFHNHLMRDLRPLARSYPMTLAESASTFAEQAFTQHVLECPDTTPGERLAVLNTRLGKAVAFLLDIPVRFRFEREFHTLRLEGEVDADTACRIMERTQREVFGDILGPDGADPWFWASKLHYYITRVAFYNFPYTFGYLFSMFLWNRFAGAGTQGFEELTSFLRASGAAEVEPVVARYLGVDLEDPDFWRTCLDPIQRDLDTLEACLG